MDTGIFASAAQPIYKPAPRSLLTSNNAPRTSSLTKINDNIIVLNAFEVKCLLLQISYMETESNAASVSGDRLGQYLVSPYLLESYGYKDNTLEDQWTGLDGVDSEELFLQVPSIQDKIMLRFIKENYNKLIQANAIRENDTKTVIAGMLAVAYQFQDAQVNSGVSTTNISNNVLAQIQLQSNYNYNAIKAQIWRDNGGQYDSLGRPAHLFFNAGKYAIQNLAADY